MAYECDECGSNRIEQREDKDNVIGYASTQPLYAKLYICKDCAHKWSSADDGKSSE